ncbi:type I methionyl aminopeptidase [Candidatus Peregrinibacteria bacterium]|nr:type I methionyl aminopeptidase [Candidatus Peregrinibacteria bacterium]
MNEPTLKTVEELKIMRNGGKILGQILAELESMVKPGITTDSLDKEAEKLFKTLGVQASFKGYRGFPKNICVCINDEIVHAIPSPNKTMQEGDLVTIDCGVYYQGFHTDSALSVGVGKISEEKKHFLETVKKTLINAIKLVKPGVRLGDLGSYIQKMIESKDYSIVRDLTGHGIGKNLHEAPIVYNFGKKGAGLALKPGMTLAIEPIVNMGKRFTKTLSDRWTIVTLDKSLSCQFEHTIAVTATGYEVLTLRPNETV